MTPTVRLVVNGTEHQVAGDMSLAAVLLNAGYSAFRHSVSGDARGPVCGMGSCFECRVTIDGVQGRRACLEPVHDGMVVSLDV